MTVARPLSTFTALTFVSRWKRHALSGEQTLKQIRQLKIEPERDARQKFQHRYFRTEPVPDGTQLEADRAGADHDQFLWSLGERQRFGAADDCFAVKFRERQFHRRAAGGNDDIFCLDLLRLAIGGFDRNFSRRGDRAQSFEDRHLVRLHQRAHAAVECLHDLVLALLHLREIGARAVDHDAVLRRFFFDEHEMIARSEKRFARDAAHVQACAAQFLVLFDKGGLQTELAGADRSNITARSRADDNNIKFFHMCCNLIENVILSEAKNLVIILSEAKNLDHFFISHGRS